MAEGLAGAGVTRVSMGAQSFDDRVLAGLGRAHDAARVAAAVATLRAAGVPALNLDLIYGGPGEDAGSWSATLEAALALGPEHLSAYALTIEPATKFGRLVATGRMAEPGEDDLADRYETACSALAAAGYHHYEVSNWASAAPGQPAQPDLLAAGAVPRPGSGGARVRRGDPAVERRRGARLPGGGRGGAAADLRGGAARPRAGPVRGAGAAAADGGRARPGREARSLGVDPGGIAGRRSCGGPGCGPGARACG